MPGYSSEGFEEVFTSELVQTGEFNPFYFQDLKLQLLIVPYRLLAKATFSD